MLSALTFRPKQMNSSVGTTGLASAPTPQAGDMQYHNQQADTSSPEALRLAEERTKQAVADHLKASKRAHACEEAAEDAANAVRSYSQRYSGLQNSNNRVTKRRLGARYERTGLVLLAALNRVENREAQAKGQLSAAKQNMKEALETEHEVTAAWLKSTAETGGVVQDDELMEDYDIL